MESRLRQARLKCGLSRDELERKAGVPMGSVALLENGSTGIATVEVLAGLAAALESTVEEIFLPCKFNEVNNRGEAKKEGGDDMWKDDLPERTWGSRRDMEDHWPTCPECGEETDTLYRNDLGVIVGCDHCINAMDAWEWPGESYDDAY